MGTSFTSRRPIPNRLFVGLLALAFAVSAGGWLGTGLAAQGQKEDEEKEPAKPKKKPPKVEGDKPAPSRPKEVEEDRPSRPRKVIPVDDEDPTPAKPRPKLQPPPVPEAQTSIVEALRDTKNPELREFYTNLKLPHDNITVRAIGDQTRVQAIEPQPTYYVGEQTSFHNGYLQALTYDKEWRPSGSPTRFVSAVRIEPYEEIVLDDVEAFLKKDLDQRPPSHASYLPRADMLKAAETVLAAADRFHASAREKGDRRGDDWNPLGQKLHERLFQIQMDRLNTFARAGDWDGASAYARTLADAYRDPKERGPIAKCLVDMIQAALKANGDHDHLREARQRLRFLEEVLPDSEALRNVANDLRRQAEGLLTQAKAIRKTQPQKAAELMELAADIYPNLPELAGELAQLNRDHPILRVGVRDLPINMIPGRATTDSDLRAIELMYEGLVRAHDDPRTGQRYEPCLAAGAPRLIPLGRMFRIARGATWSDGTPVTGDDVKATLRAMRDPTPNKHWPGYSPLWNRMIDDPEGGSDSFRLSLRLHQGYLDPLSLMTFKVMSQSVLAKQPWGPDPPKVGSGPFQYKGTASTTRDRKMAVFLASPGYASREGKLGLPRMREIHMVQFAGAADDPATALANGQIDLLLDPSPTTVAALRTQDGVEVRGPMTSRRVYFLAVNHRVGLLKGFPTSPLRQALALAIDRQAILDKCFRAEPGKLHHSLNSPFPAGSWPCDTAHVPAELCNLDGAKGQARLAVEKAGGPIKLTLLYPAGDPATKAAVEQLRDSVNKELHLDDKNFIELQPEEVLPAKLRERVEQTHDYQLAYYHYDHPSEAYWLAPLFDLAATDINGSNYLGYLDPELQALFAQAKNHRDFRHVQEAMRLSDRMLAQRLPLIPLWQLDTFIAYRTSLKPTPVDPVLIFNDVEHWSLDKR
jgi:ABC-type transport system substrate-binding protein